MKINKILIVSEMIANKVAEGDIVKLGNLFEEDNALVITKTKEKLTVIVDNECYDFLIEKEK